MPATAVYARARFGLNILTDTLHKDTYPADYFDVITSFQVLEHLPYPQDSLKLLSNVLKKNGLIFIEVPRFDSWTMSLMRSKHRHFVQDHLNFFSYATLSQFLRDNGFEVVESYQPKRTMSMRHFYSYWLARKMPRAISRFGERVMKSSGLWDKSFGINIGDMIAIIGRKL